MLGGEDYSFKRKSSYRRDRLDLTLTDRFRKTKPNDHMSYSLNSLKGDI